MLKLPVTRECYFCELIAQGSQCWNLLASDEVTVTLLNGRQYETGQSIVIPRRHAPTLMDLRAHEHAAILAAAQTAAEAMLASFDGVEGILLYQNNGVGSGQEVPHFHLHVVPRQSGSEWGLGPPHLARFEREGRPARFDHSAATEDKLATVARMRARWK